MNQDLNENVKEGIKEDVVKNINENDSENNENRSTSRPTDEEIEKKAVIDVGTTEKVTEVTEKTTDVGDIEGKEINEGSARIFLNKHVFYNQHMEICRDVMSLSVSTLPRELTVCDGMCASGVRGIRYALENDNVRHVTFVDMDEAAIALVMHNLVLNNLDFPAVQSDINHYLYRGGEKFNFVEIDPFGSPVPFVRAALLNLRASKEGYLSVTATDTAVLCGAQSKACNMYYTSRPLHNYFCHEAGVRILIGYIARVASPLGLGIQPLLSLSKRHYFKVLLKVKKGAIAALDSLKQLGYVSWCPSCFDIRLYNKPFLKEECGVCSRAHSSHVGVEWAGPLWLGKIEDSNIITGMKEKNLQRDYKNKKEIMSLLHLLSFDAEMPPFYFDFHAIFDKLNMPSKKFDTIVKILTENGFRVTNTHFCQTAIKTDAPAEVVLDAVKRA